MTPYVPHLAVELHDSLLVAFDELSLLVAGEQPVAQVEKVVSGVMVE